MTIADVQGLQSILALHAIKSWVINLLIHLSFRLGIKLTSIISSNSSNLQSNLFLSCRTWGYLNLQRTFPFLTLLQYFLHGLSCLWNDVTQSMRSEIKSSKFLILLNLLYDGCQSGL